MQQRRAESDSKHMMMERYLKPGRRRTSPDRRSWLLPFWLLLLSIAICWVLLSVFRRFPMETLIFGTVIVIAVSGVLLYIGELFVLGWVVDFLSDFGMPKSKARLVPLDWECVGDVIVVTLRDNIATAAQCRTVEKQLKCLLDEHHCDFILDFYFAARVSKSFREVMLNLMKAARKEAENAGKPDRSMTLPDGATFRVFDDKQEAVEEMSRQGGHGWVVLCSVPTGIRAVADLI
jgi:hypothetical protein